MCQKCGCNKCETVRGPLLTEGKVKKLISENLSYHIDNNISLMENVFRIGSDAHLSMIKEARKLYTRNVLDLCEEDKALMETHIGEFDLYENEIVPLDLPMLDESKYDKEETIQQTIDRLKARIEDPNDGGNVPFLVQKIKDLEKSLSEATEYKGRKLSHEEEDRLDLIAHKEFNCDFKDCSDEDKSKIWNKRNLVGVNEAKKKKEKKDPPIGKPKRGGSKAYYVYVRDPKTKKVKKVSFGSGGLRAKIRNPKARKAFAARHNCKNKKDRTKAGYWSCNLPRYASQLGLGANMNTFW